MCVFMTGGGGGGAAKEDLCVVFNVSSCHYSYCLATFSGLIVLETTNDVLNNTLLDAITPKALLSWHRMRLANWLANGGEQWAAYFSEYNSGMERGGGCGKVTLKGCGHPLQGPTITSTWFWT